MTICCDVTCPVRMECKQFQRALEINAGKKTVYDIIECNSADHYEK